MKNIYVLSLILLLFVNATLAQVWPAALGAGMNNDVNAIAVDDANNIVYAGGLFTQAGGQPANKIAKWTGSAWQPMGSGVVGNVYAMKFYNGRLYVGGAFSSIDGVALANVAYYDGTWHAMDSGLVGTLAEVRAFTVFNNEVVAGGKFSASSSMNNLGNVARWNGSIWMPFGTGLNDKVWALEVFQNDLYAAGQFDSTGSGVFCRAVGKWNGNMWQSLGEGPQILVRALCVYNNYLYAGGNFNCQGNSSLTEYITSNGLSRWDGALWHNIGPSAWNGGSPVNCTGTTDLVSALYSFGGELWMGGLFTTVRNAGPSISCAYRIARCDGYFFAPVGAGCDGLSGALSFVTVNAISEYNGNLILGGRFSFAGGDTAHFITLLNPPPINELYVYNDLEYHHLGMEDPKKLFGQRVDIRPLSELKICADGTKSTVFKFVVKDAVSEANVRFRVKGDSLNANPTAFGEFNTADYAISGDTVQVRFTHPQFISTAAIQYVTDSFQIMDISNSKVLYTFPVKYYRAPVTLIHGIWSNGNFWKPFEQQLLLSGFLPELVFRPDYENTHAVAFSQNALVVPEAIRQVLMQSREANYSAGASDLIVHSMGGVLSRLYIQQTPYHYDVHKLITVNSVHSGTQACNLLTNPAFAGLDFVFGWGGMDCFGGAVEDFKVNSPAILGSLNGGLLNFRKVPSHTYTSHITVSQMAQATAMGDWTTFFGYTAALWAGFGSTVTALDVFMAAVFQSTNHDLIVAEESQRGGCDKTTSVTPYWHSSVKEDASLFPGIIQLEKQSAVDTNYFSMNGFNPPTLTSIYLPAGGNNNGNRSTGDVMFTNLSDIDTITSNMQVTFDVASTGDIQRMFVALIGSPDAILMADTAAPSASITFVIDNRIFGHAKAIVIGYDSTGVIDIDTVEIVVNDYLGYQCFTLSAYPEITFLTPGNSGNVQVAASCSGGERNITSSENCTYQVLNPAVAMHTSSNKFQALQPGETKVVVSYNGLTDTVKIIVNDTIVNQVQTSIEVINEKSNSVETNDIRVYPNPANTEIIFETKGKIELKNAQLEIFDLAGRRVIYRGKVNGLHFKVNIEELKNGIYFYQIKNSDAEHFTGKVLKM